MTDPTVDTEMREFAKVLRQALLMIVRYLEKRYQLGVQRDHR